MGTLWITEYKGAGYAAGRQVAPPPLNGANSAPIATGSSASTYACAGNTCLIDVQADVATFLLAGSSASTSVATSTNAVRIPAGAAPLRYSVTPYSRLTAITT